MSDIIESAETWRQWRIEHNMSQAAMARTLGLALRTVQGIEANEHQPSYTSKMRFSELRKRYERNAQ